jgi:hypothetical protein
MLESEERLKRRMVVNKAMAWWKRMLSEVYLEVVECV